MEEGKPQNAAKRTLFGSAEATVLAALFTVAGALAGALIKGYYDGNAEQLRGQSALAIEDRKAVAGIALEQQKFQAELILKAIDTEDQTGAVKTLKFFANAGLIPNYQEKVLALTEVEQGAAIPALRAPSEFLPVSEFNKQRNISAQSRSVAFLTINGSQACTAVLVQNLGLVFPAFCVRDNMTPNAVRAIFDFLSLDSPQSEWLIMEITEIASPVAGLKVAQLKNGSMLERRGVSLGNLMPIPGEPVFMISHPEGQPQQVSTDCHVVGLVNSAVPRAPSLDGVDMFAFECRSVPGSAGGPIFAQKDGVLLGVAAAGDKSQEFRKYGILTAGLLAAE